jgi:hypothetical protein
LERQGIKVALEALAAERRARAEALVQEEEELARRIAEERSTDAAQKIEAVRAALGRRLLDAEEAGAARSRTTSPVGATRHTPSRLSPNSSRSHAGMSDEEVERRLAEQRAAKLQREQEKRTASAWPLFLWACFAARLCARTRCTPDTDMFPLSVRAPNSHGGEAGCGS